MPQCLFNSILALGYSGGPRRPCKPAVPLPLYFQVSGVKLLIDQRLIHLNEDPAEMIAPVEAAVFGG